MVADVGQNLFEEINSVVLGGNYGWVIREGAHCFDPLDPVTEPTGCPTVGLIDPFAEYEHSDGLSIIGGFVYRGTQFPALVGQYIFGDFSQDFGPTGRIFTLDFDGDRSLITEVQIGAANAPLNLFLKSSGIDDDGEIYFLAGEELAPAGSSGLVFRVIAPAEFIRGETNGDGVLDSADALLTLAHLFAGGDLTCADAGDANDDGLVDVGDPIFTLNHLFLGGSPPSAPYPSCGLDPTLDAVPGGNLGCASTAACP